MTVIWGGRRAMPCEEWRGHWCGRPFCVVSCGNHYCGVCHPTPEPWAVTLARVFMERGTERPT